MSVEHNITIHCDMEYTLCFTTQHKLTQNWPLTGDWQTSLEGKHGTPTHTIDFSSSGWHKVGKVL